MIRSRFLAIDTKTHKDHGSPSDFAIFAFAAWQVGLDPGMVQAGTAMRHDVHRK